MLRIPVGIMRDEFGVFVPTAVSVVLTGCVSGVFMFLSFKLVT